MFRALGLLAIFGATTAAQTALEVGKPAPDFELRDASGQLHRLSDYRGEKHVVLEFFRSGDW